MGRRRKINSLGESGWGDGAEDLEWPVCSQVCL